MKNAIVILMLLSVSASLSAQRIIGAPKQSYDVNVQDQYSDAVIFKMNMIEANTTLAIGTSKNDTSIVLTSVASVDVGDYIIIFEPAINRVYKGYALSISGDTVSMDTPLDVDFSAGAYVDVTVTNMNVDGSIGKKVFGLRGVSEEPIGATLDITRLIFHCQTSGAVSLAKFGDLTALEHGIVLRKRDGDYYDIFNVKSNGELASLMFDFTPYVATNPSQGQNGFLSRLTFAGQNKIGVTIRVMPGEDLEIIIQDDLSSLLLFEVIAEGHIVVD